MDFVKLCGRLDRQSMSETRMSSTGAYILDEGVGTCELIHNSANVRVSSPTGNY